MTRCTLPEKSWFFESREVMHFQIMGHELASDFAFCTLDPKVGTGHATSVLKSRSPFPEPGALVRELVDKESGSARIRVFEGTFGIQYWVTDVGRFWIGPSGRCVRYELSRTANPGDAENVFVGPVLALALQLQGQVQLHASAVVLDSTAVAFTAFSGAGKSTLAASFVRAGHALLADDILPVYSYAAGVKACHSLSRMKLWGDTLEALGEDEHRYDLALSWTTKRQVHVGQHWGEVAAGEFPLAAVYFLNPHRYPGKGIEFSDLDPVTAAMQLLASMYMPELLRGERAARALATAARMVAAVRLRRVSYPRAYAELPALRAAILADLHGGRGAA